MTLKTDPDVRTLIVLLSRYVPKRQNPCFEQAIAYNITKLYNYYLFIIIIIITNYFINISVIIITTNYFINISVIQCILPLRKIVFLHV